MQYFQPTSRWSKREHLFLLRVFAAFENTSEVKGRKALTKRMHAGCTLKWLNWTKYQCYSATFIIAGFSTKIILPSASTSLHLLPKSFGTELSPRQCLRLKFKIFSGLCSKLMSVAVTLTPRCWVLANWCWHLPKHLSDNVRIAFDLRWLYWQWRGFALVIPFRSLLWEGSPESFALWVTDCPII